MIDHKEIMGYPKKEREQIMSSIFKNVKHMIKICLFRMRLYVSISKLTRKVSVEVVY